MALSCVVCDKARYWSKIVIFHIPLHSTPPLGGSHRNFAIAFGTEKLKWWGYSMMKNFEDKYIRLDRISACDGQTDGRTDGHILPWHSPRYAYASRGKNGWTEFDANWHKWTVDHRARTWKGQLWRSSQRSMTLDVKVRFGSCLTPLGCIGLVALKCTSYFISSYVRWKVKVKVWPLAIAPLTDSWPAALYNLGSGSCLVWTNGAAAHYVAIHCSS